MNNIHPCSPKRPDISHIILSLSCSNTEDCVKDLKMAPLLYKMLQLASAMLVHELCVGIFEQYMGARNQVGIGFSYRPARLHRLAESIPWNRFLGSIEV
jgi:hypothetical protein